MAAIFGNYCINKPLKRFAWLQNNIFRYLFHSAFVAVLSESIFG